jgi:hypothetical protein
MMKRWLIACFVLVWVIVLVSDPGVTVQFRMETVESSSASPVTSVGLGNTPLYFIPNKGQVHEQVKFYARASGYTLWITKDGLVFDSIGEKGGEAVGRCVSRLLFPAARENPGMVPVETTGHRVNYLKGTDRSGWVTGIETSKAVLYTDIYDHIDLKVYGIEKQIEYDWIVNPGADPGNIRFLYKDVKGTHLDEKGNLVVKTGLGELTHKRPFGYQEIDGRTAAVAVDFEKVAENTYGFRVGEYDKTYPLIIDPVVMVYSTYLGGSGSEIGSCLTVDNNGCAYIGGDTGSSDFPTEGAYQSTSGGSVDAFVSKFSSSGNSLLYSTYIGGSGDDEAEGLRVDGSGRLYIAGTTASSDFPTQNAYKNSSSGGKDVFVAILSADGSSLEYSTYLGGSGDDRAFAIALDSSKNIYVTGDTGSANFPKMNAYQVSHGGGTHDAFVTRIEASGSSLGYSTFLGGNGAETGYGIAVNGSNAYVTGRTTSSNFPVKNDYQSSHGGGTYDAFVTKLASTGKTLIYSTYLGGSQDDNGYGIDVDSSGKAYVTGDTHSTNFPTENAYQVTHGGGNGGDAFVTAFSTTGTTLSYSTFLGGSEGDAGAHVAVNSSGYACITGYTSSSDFPTVRANQTVYSGDRDVIVAMLSPSGNSLTFSTYLGGSDFDTGRGIFIDSNGDVYVAGFTGSTDFPDKSAYQGSLKGSRDTFVAKYSTSEYGTLCGGVDACELTWTTGGDANWFEQTDDFYYDNDAVRSGALSGAGSTYMQTTVIGPCEFSYFWKVSSSYSHYLRFYVNGELKDSISGTWSYVNWSERLYDLPAGTHTLKWEYTKNSSYGYGDDAGWVDKVVYKPGSSIELNRTQLTFGAVEGFTSPDQTFTVSNTTSSPFKWTASGSKNWMSCTPNSGNGRKEITVSVDAAGLPAGTYTGSISVAVPGAANSPQTVDITLNVYKANRSSVPFGDYATPLDNSTIMSSVPFTGWVLDDVGVESVKLYRLQNSQLIYIGDAVLVEGSRPDVEQAYPSYPHNYRAGWGYMMLTNFLPGGGNGTFSIVAIATDTEGHQVTLGTKTVTVDNNGAVKPFGALDTPRQGGIASGGSFVNWGWVLATKGNSIPTDGSSIDVWVDSVKLGHPTYNIYRSDIADLFPGYANSDGAVGYYYLDTTAYQDGVHAIQWTAKDSAGHTDGIGSRYFMIKNTGQRSQQAARINGYTARQPGLVKNINRLPIDYFTPIGVSKGFKEVEAWELEMVHPDDKGFVKLEMRELERIQLHLGCGGKVSGWMKVGEQFRPLPPGSHLDPVSGTFSWIAAPAFVGSYHLVFIAEDQTGNEQVKNVLINIIQRY